MLNANTFHKLFPNAKPGVLDAFNTEYAFLGQHGIYPGLRLNHFLAQLAHESMGFFYLEEIASGQAYEGRKSLGNTQPGDGRRFKGRGIIQLTGRANYKYFGDKLGVDLISNPELAANPEVAVKVAVLYWDDRQLNKLADKNDINTITKKINGGLNGLADRKAWYAKITKKSGLLI